MGCRQIQGVCNDGEIGCTRENLGGRTSETGVGKSEIGGLAFFLHLPNCANAYYCVVFYDPSSLDSVPCGLFV